jgi:hypothetical protein
MQQTISVRRACHYSLILLIHSFCRVTIVYLYSDLRADAVDVRCV